MILLVREPHFKDHSSVIGAMLNFVTIKNLMGKCGLLTGALREGPVSCGGDSDIVCGLFHVSQYVPPHCLSPSLLRVP